MNRTFVLILAVAASGAYPAPASAGQDGGDGDGDICVNVWTEPGGDRVFLMPAWPKDWDVDFRLHAPRQTVIEGKIRGGKVADLKVTPDERRKDVILP